jgi:acyl-CoA thioester hydrolase
MKPLFVEEVFEPKTYDIDYAGIVSNQVYIRWLEDLRFKLIKEYYNWDSLMGEIVPMIIRTEVDYLKSVKLREIVKGKMWMDNIRGPRYFLKAEMIVNGRIVCSSVQQGVFINSSTGRIIRIPEGIKKHFQNNG